MRSQSKMEISFTHRTTSQYQQGLNKNRNCDDGINKNSNCDDTIKKLQKSSRRQRTIYRYDVTTAVFVGLFYLLTSGYLAGATACPSECSCSVESKVFCNNKGLKSTPTDFTSVVEELYLFNNNITSISPRSLQPLKNLKILDLSGNRITNYALWDDIFSQLKLLENLILHENKISRITFTMFKGLTNLARIYLQNNEISIIEVGAFNNLPNLVELKLRNNRLISFPKLEHTPNLLLLDLGYNRLRTIRDLALSTVNLEHLKLQSNQLTQLRTSVFDDTSRLTQLDISNNRLTAVPLVVKSLISLRALNMSLNKVQSIPQDTFKAMTSLKVLDLHGMALKTFPFGIIPPRVILNVLDITNNNWDCGCGTSWLPQYISIFEQAFVDPDEIKCSTDSRLKGRKIRDLKTEDFACTEDELAKTLLPPTVSTTTSVRTPVRPSRRPWGPDTCDVYPCFHGGTCSVVVGQHPRCRCRPGWSGLQCQVSLTPPTTTTRRTTISTTRTNPPNKPSDKPQLLINKESITESSVEIILPQTETELVVSVSEIGQTQKPKELRIKPMAHPFTVIGLESGKAYNICIHLPLGRKDHLPPYVDNTDTLCGLVKTGGIRLINTPVVTTKIQVVPSPGGKNDESPTEKGDKDKDAKPYKPGMGEGQHGDVGSDTTPSESTDFKIIYPAVGAGIGAIVIIVLLVMFFVCYRQKRMQKLKNQNNQDYIPGSPVDTTQMGDLEMATVVHHHHHNHYNAGGIEPNSAVGGKKQKLTTKKQNNNKQSSFINNNSAPKSTTPIKTSSLGRSSNSGSSHSGTPRYVETPHHYHPQQQYMPPSPANLPQYEAIPPQQRNGRASEYIYRNHQNNNNSSMMQVPNNHCVPGRHYDPDVMDDMQPLVGGMNQYHYRPVDGPVYQDQYAMPPRNESAYISPPIPYPPANSRSAFQPIQSPRHNTVRTPTSESGPITTHVNTAHVMPTSTCLNRNLMTENMARYSEGVPVV